MRYRMSHLLGFVFVAALVFAVIRHPESLWALVVPLIGGCCVVLPVLGTIELFSGRESATPQVGWGSGCLVVGIAIAGMVVAVILLSLIV